MLHDRIWHFFSNTHLTKEGSDNNLLPCVDYLFINTYIHLFQRVPHSSAKQLKYNTYLKLENNLYKKYHINEDSLILTRGKRGVLTLGSLCLPCYVRDTA